MSEKIYLLSLKLYKLSKKNILKICKLKNENWRYGVNSNLNWFKKNIKKNDIHNLFFLNKRLIGYTLLRKRIAIIKKKNNTRKINYLYFDTLIISKKFRNKNYSKILMTFNSKRIINQKLHSFLICSKKTINYYKKFHWKILSKKKFRVMDHQSKKFGMVFNNKVKLKETKFLYFIN